MCLRKLSGEAWIGLLALLFEKLKQFRPVLGPQVMGAEELRMRPSTWSRRPLRAKLAHHSRALQLAIAKLESVSMGPTTFGELETSLFATSAVDTPRGSRA